MIVENENFKAEFCLHENTLQNCIKMPISDSGSESGSHKSIRDKRPSGPSGDGKPTRVRTVLNEKQLHTLR